MYNGYRLLACDGSDLCIAHSPEDKTTYFQSTPDFHLNALYNLCMCNFIDSYKGSPKTIFIADRGYENYNILLSAKRSHAIIKIKTCRRTGLWKLYQLMDMKRKCWN